MKYLSLFTGYGGLDLALQHLEMEPIAYVEIEEYAQRIIAERMADGGLKRAVILADVKNVRGSIGVCDLIVAGFPCQDISLAGTRKGLAGERSGLFYEIVRLTKEIKPTFVFVENVEGIRTKGLREVGRAFTDLGYDFRWTRVSAKSVGANHRRNRFFGLAYKDVANSMREGREWSTKRKIQVLFATERSWWQTEPNVGRVANGTPFGMDRIKAIGNGVVPAQARAAFNKLLGLI